MVDWRDDAERWVDRRMQYLERATKLDDTDAEIIAWSELGYSSSGIAKKVDLGESTVKTHLEEIAEQFGVEATYARPSSGIGVDTPLVGDRND